MVNTKVGLISDVTYRGISNADRPHWTPLANRSNVIDVVLAAWIRCSDHYKWNINFYIIVNQSYACCRFKTVSSRMSFLCYQY